jgi:NADH:ubiquinone oxidoreductase subunit 4 (subunit M)
MERLMDRIKTRDLVRWSVIALLIALMLWITPDYWAAERLPRTLEAVRGVGTMMLLVLSVLLFRARYDSPRRKTAIHLSMSTIMLIQCAIVVGFNAKSLAMLAVFAVLARIEWQRAVEEERRYA